MDEEVIYGSFSLGRRKWKYEQTLTSTTVFGPGSTPTTQNVRSTSTGNTSKWFLRGNSPTVTHGCDSVKVEEDTDKS